MPQRRRCRRPRHPQRASLRRISTLAAAFSISVGSALVPAPRLRRDVLLLAPPAAAAAALSAPSAFFASCLAAAPAPAGAAQTTAEAVRRAASILPGLGQPDVYYPPLFLGSWRATRTVVSSDDPSLAPLLPLEVSYEAQYVSVDGDGSGADGKVVSDRGYNEASYRSALRSAVLRRDGAGDFSDARPPPAVRSYSWSASNPNVLFLSFADGSSEEVKVTKRATDLGGGAGAGAGAGAGRTTTPPCSAPSTGG